MNAVGLDPLVRRYFLVDQAIDFVGHAFLMMCFLWKAGRPLGF